MIFSFTSNCHLISVFFFFFLTRAFLYFLNALVRQQKAGFRGSAGAPFWLAFGASRARLSGWLSSSAGCSASSQLRMDLTFSSDARQVFKAQVHLLPDPPWPLRSPASARVFLLSCACSALYPSPLFPQGGVLQEKGALAGHYGSDLDSSPWPSPAAGRGTARPGPPAALPTGCRPARQGPCPRTHHLPVGPVTTAVCAPIRGLWSPAIT